MCGIAGFWSRSALTAESARTRMEVMRDTISNRGPDDAGVWVNGSLAFGHRRLSIIDLSPLGHQPMTSADGRFTICYNGEVFNFAALRDELVARGHSFRGGSDTEVMLAAFAEWGVVAAVTRFVGMFAFAVWDAKHATLHLVRDRLGIKPLYIGRTPSGDLVFASELKALMGYPGFERRLDPDAVMAYLRFGYVPSPKTIFVDAMKLAPGHAVSLTSPAAAPQPEAFWSLEAVAREGKAAPFTGAIDAAEDALDRLLRDAVALRMIADVPLGAFLSGGVDSSLVVSLMQAQASHPVKTFTIGFADARYDESAFAKTIASHLGTEHTEHVVTPNEALSVIPQLSSMYDEPMSDASQIPTYLVSALARKHVTVALSGDGGDELFGGYARYRFAPSAWRWVQRVPKLLRAPVARALRGIAGRGIPALAGGGTRATKTAHLLEAPNLESMYRTLVSVTPDLSALTTLAAEPAGPLQALLSSSAEPDAVGRMMLADTMVYLPDDLLTKLDRASMAVGLEGRVPLLDHRVAAFAWRLPLAMRTGKILLRRVLGRYVPRELFERPKMGFEVPIAAWLRGPLNEWAHSVLDAQTLEATGIFNAGAVARALHDHSRGRRNHGHVLWGALMFEEWRRRWNASL